MGRRRVLGVTGLIACGKSTVARLLATRGAEVIDADAVAHAVMAPGTPVHQAIVQTFGPGILRSDGQIDRRKLGAIVFRDPALLRRLEQIVWPEVVARIHAQVARSQAPLVVIEAIGLFEAGLDRLCDAIWVVTCRPDQQLARLMQQRGLSREEAEIRLQAQGDIAPKLARATVVIDNTGPLEETERQVERALQRLLAADP